MYFKLLHPDVANVCNILVMMLPVAVVNPNLSPWQLLRWIQLCIFVFLLKVISNRFFLY